MKKGRKEGLTSASMKVEKQASFSSRAEKERELTIRWQRTKDPAVLEELLNSLKPLIQKHARTYLGRVKMVPDSAIEAEFKMQAIHALERYNPAAGVQVSTWVYRHLPKGGRMIKKYQNVARIPERRLEKLGDFLAVKADLAERLGRPATEMELLGELQQRFPAKRWTLLEVQRLNTDLRADVQSSAFEDDMHSWMPSIDDEIAAYLDEDLTPEERKVWALLRKSKEKMPSTRQMAKQLGFSAPKVSRLRRSIERKFVDARSLFRYDK